MFAYGNEGGPFCLSKKIANQCKEGTVCFVAQKCTLVISSEKHVCLNGGWTLYILIARG